MDKAKLIEELICYATKNLSLKELDSYYVRNILMRKFKVDKTYDGEIDKKAIEELSLPDIFCLLSIHKILFFFSVIPLSTQQKNPRNQCFWGFSVI